MTTIDESLLTVFSKREKVPVELVKATESPVRLAMIQDYLINSIRLEQNYRRWLDKSDRELYVELAIAIDDHGGSPLEHIQGQFIKNLEGAIDDLPEHLARTIFAGAGDHYWEHHPPQFLTSDEYMAKIKELEDAKKFAYRYNGPPLVAKLANWYVARFGFTDEIIAFFKRGSNMNFMNGFNYDNYLKLTDDASNIVRVLRATDRIDSLLVNPHLSATHVHEAISKGTPHTALNIVKKLSASPATESLVSEYAALEGSLIAGEAPVELIDKLKATKLEYRGSMKSRAASVIELAECKIHAYEANYENLQKRAARARINAEKGKVTLDYATKLEDQLKVTDSYVRGCAMVALAQAEVEALKAR